MSIPSIDVQQHWVPPALQRFLEQQQQAIPNPALGALGSRLREMDEVGMISAVVSIPKLGYYGVSAGQITDVVRRCNDELLTEASRHDGRFGVWLTLPFPASEACIDELDRLQGERLVRGVIVFAANEHWTIDEPRFEQVYATIAERKLVVMLHPADDALTRLPLFASWQLASSIAAMVETSVAGARLILSGMLDRVPDLTVLIPHLGGAIPHLAQRIVDQSGSGDAERDFLYYLQHRCLTDTCSFHPPALACAAATFTTERMMLGSDFPFRGTLARAVNDLDTDAIPAAAHGDVLSGNAIAFGLGL